MSTERFFKRNIKIETMIVVWMEIKQRIEHVLVTLGIKDAFQDDVVAMIKRKKDDVFDKRRVHAIWNIFLF